MTVSPHLFFCAGDRYAPGKQLGNVRTSLEELSPVKIRMVLKYYRGLLPELPDIQALLSKEFRQIGSRRIAAG